WTSPVMLQGPGHASRQAGINARPAKNAGAQRRQGGACLRLKQRLERLTLAAHGRGEGGRSQSEAPSPLHAFPLRRAGARLAKARPSAASAQPIRLRLWVENTKTMMGEETFHPDTRALLAYGRALAGTRAAPKKGRADHVLERLFVIERMS